ncbi:MAG: hypothetical protein RBT61_01105 [Candidatus Kapabacteria bacterium]|jgi:hypothetical protein|nr:hypothetical protein [Candidatus Kapabacteria bacterium]
MKNLIEIIQKLKTDPLTAITVSDLAIQKTEDYLSAQAKNNIDVVSGVKDTAELYALIKDYEPEFD